MKRNLLIKKMLQHTTVYAILFLFCLATPGCLIIGAKDGNVGARVAIIESRFDNLERLYATSPSQQQYGQQFEQQNGFATSNQLAEAYSGNRNAPR